MPRTPVLYRPYIFQKPFWKFTKVVGDAKRKKLIQACRHFRCCPYNSASTPSAHNDHKYLTIDDSSDLELVHRYRYKTYKKNSRTKAEDTTSTTLLGFFLPCLPKIHWLRQTVRDEIQNKLQSKTRGQSADFQFGRMRQTIPAGGHSAQGCQLGIGRPPSGHLVQAQTPEFLLRLLVHSGSKDGINYGAERLHGVQALKVDFRQRKTQALSLLQVFRHSMPDPGTCLGKEMTFVQMKMLLQSSWRHYGVSSGGFTI
nr:alkane hydroxylase MAH1-like [Ipomoea batatas]